MGSFAPHGHARLDPRSPKAFGLCDICQFLYLRSDLRPQTQWMGNEIRPTGFYACPTCLDVPNPQLRPKSLPADPVPILQPRRDPPDPLVDQTVLTVATLPAAGSVALGAYRFVNDSTVSPNWGTYGQIVLGGGTSSAPVQSDLTNWRIA